MYNFLKKTPLLISILLFLGASGTAYVFFILKDLPRPELFDTRQINQSTKILDRTGKVVLYEIYGEEKRTVIPFEEIPENVKRATVAIEDATFYNHSALNYRSILRALFTNISSGEITQGGSTITQQLAKNAFLSTEKTLTRKLKEAVIAYQLERKYSKDEILNFYLNQIPYGSNAYGIQAASQTFFNKNARDLTLNEAALLVSLPQAPSYYSPYGSHIDQLLRRRDIVLLQMEKEGYITSEERQEAKAEILSFTPQSYGIKAPHFSILIQEYLINKYGEDYVRKAGLKVISTLDYDLQQIAEKAVREGAERNTRLYKGTNASMVVMNSKTGEVLVMVGSYDYFNIKNDGNFNVATQGLRQPGSAIKPIVYLTAFTRGYTPNTILFDTPTDFDTSGINPYTPQNFDNTFRGPVDMRHSLAQSLNVPAVKTLYLAGINNVLSMAEKLGITTLTEKNRYGLSLALGGGEIKLIELVGAYSVFSNDGVKHKPAIILEIQDTKGIVLEKYKDKEERVVDAEPIRKLNDVLTDINARKELYHGSLGLTLFPGYEVAIKTGTTNDYRDAWTIGYTPSLVTGVWVGNNNNNAMQKQGGSILAALPIWNAFMKEALLTQESEIFPKSQEDITGKPILEGKYIINGEIHDTLYYINKADPRGLPPTNPERDSQFSGWEGSLQEWLDNHPGFQGNQRENINTSENSGNNNLTLISPKTGIFIQNNQIPIQFTYKGINPVISIEILLNSLTLFTEMRNYGNDFTFSELISLSNIESQNQLTIRLTTSNKKIIENNLILYR